MNLNIDQLLSYLATNGVDFALKLGASLLMWMVGRWLIAVTSGLINRGIQSGGKIDATLAKFITSIISGVLTVGLALGVMGYLGVETASFAALLAGVGLAVGTAWGGLLAHFAAGVFMQVFRPVNVGDYVVAGGVEGTVTQMGLFGISVLTPDNCNAIVGNNAVFSGVIRNYSAEPFRRVDCVAKVANSVNPLDAIELLRPAIAKIPNVMANPAPEIEILEFTPEGPKLCVRPYCHTKNYWQVYFETNKAIVETFGGAGYPVPMTPVAHKTVV